MPRSKQRSAQYRFHADHVTPSPRAAWLLVGVALAALLLPPPVSLILALCIVTAVTLDARAARPDPRPTRSIRQILSRGVPADMAIASSPAPGNSVRMRQSTVPDIDIDPQESTDDTTLTMTARRRGRHALPPLAARTEGPLRLGRWHHHSSEPVELRVYPDLHAARRIALAVRTGRFANEGRLTRGPLGLGTDFESIRDYVPDDDIRQVNWRASARLGRPMSNQYRVEQDRDVICLVDCGRLMASPIGDRTRLDAALDATVAVALVADVVGDRVGAIAFDSKIKKRIPPSRRGGDDVAHGLFDLEPSLVDSDFELAFRSVGGGKRSLVLIFTDMIDDAAASSLLEAVPIISRRHVVVVASVSDPELMRPLRTLPSRALDVYRQVVSLDVLESRRKVVTRLRHHGAIIVEAEPDALAPACVRAYLTSKNRARL